MIGFGKTNRQIFLTSVANNQFITEREGRTELKKVHYHIFDKNPAENNKNLNHSYYRYKQEREGYDADAYLPLPSLPADESYHKLDVNDTRFYNVLHDAFTSEKNSVNFASSLSAATSKTSILHRNCWINERNGELKTLLCS